MTGYYGRPMALTVALCSAQPVLAANVRIPTKEVTFYSAGTALSGALVTPSTITAAAVVVHGSGQQKRMLPFAYELAQQGVATYTSS
jgi:poly(3-hydroxybutyrate) depolymerase